MTCRSAFRLSPVTRLAAGVVTLVFLAGCGPGDGPPREGQPVVVRVWHQKDAAERALLERWAAEYNARQDTVQLDLLYKETEELRNHYVFAAIGGRGPDLIYGPADNVGTLGVTETVMPLDGVVDPAYLAGFDDDGLLRYEGRLVGVADQIGNHLTLVYNTALLPSPPTTLDSLAALGATLTRDTDGDGRADQYALTWNYTEPFFFIPFLTAYGGWVMDDEGNPTLDTPETVRAIEYVLELRRAGTIPPTTDYETANTLFREGASAMIINGPWSWAGYGDAGVDYALAPLPRDPATGRYAQPMAAAKAYSVNPGVPAWKLPTVLGVLRLLTDDAMQTQMARELAAIPVRTAVRTSPVMDENPILRQSLAQIAHSRPMPTAPQMRQIWDAMRGPYQLVMNGEVSAAEGARLMQQEAEKRIADTFLE